MSGSSPEEPVVWILLHDLARTGVPIVLERLLRAAGRKDRVNVVAVHGGAVRRRLDGLTSTCTVLEPDGRRSLTGAAAAGAAELGAPVVGGVVRRAAWRARLRHLPDPDVVLVHGAGGWPIVASVRGAPPLVVHLHELELGLDRSIDPAEQSAVFRRAVAVLAVSSPVADMAVRRGADPTRVELVPGVVEVPDPDEGSVRPVVAARCPPVMGAGTPGWRKATDRVAAVAHELARRGRPGSVGWVGGAPGGADTRWVGAADAVRWYDEVDDPWTVMDGCEVVLVPSREDPLPLVALEAGLRSKAVVATPTGGLADLLAAGRGAVAPVHAVDWLAAATDRLLAHPGERAAMGSLLRAEVLARHDAAVVAPTWWSVLRSAAS